MSLIRKVVVEVKEKLEHLQQLQSLQQLSTKENSKDLQESLIM